MLDVPVAPGSDRSPDAAGKPEFRRQPVGSRAHKARTLVQSLDRQPPDRPRNTDGTDDLPAEIADGDGDAAHLGVEFTVVDGKAGAPHLGNLTPQGLRRGN